jgi:L-fuculose-phosphate aldolase
MVTAIGEVMREAYKRGWITARDGNVSVVSNGNFYITPSGVVKHQIHPDGVSKYRNITPNTTEYGNVYWGKFNPSIETEMHWKVHQLSTRTCKSVVHLHPTYTIALMYKLVGHKKNVGLPFGDELQKIAAEFPELRRYTQVGKIADFSEPGSRNLAEDVQKAFVSEDGMVYDIVGMHRHGVTAFGKNPWDAFEHIERLEHISQIYLASGVL